MNARGFSLLEALVTLVILSLIATVMMQGLSQLLGARESLLRSEREARLGMLQEQWFRESIGAAVADLPGRPGAFTGDDERMGFQTADALDGSGVAAVEWRIDDSDGVPELRVLIGGKAWRVATMTADGAGFRYRDAAGAWHRQWPPQASPAQPAGQGDVLPRAVSVSVASARGATTWLAAVGATPALPAPLRVQLEGLDGRAP